jgi:hypothetical protein
MTNPHWTPHNTRGRRKVGQGLLLASGAVGLVIGICLVAWIKASAALSSEQHASFLWAFWSSVAGIAAVAGGLLTIAKRTRRAGAGLLTGALAMLIALTFALLD